MVLIQCTRTEPKISDNIEEENLFRSLLPFGGGNMFEMSLKRVYIFVCIFFGIFRLEIENINRTIHIICFVTKSAIPKNTHMYMQSSTSGMFSSCWRNGQNNNKTHKDNFL